MTSRTHALDWRDASFHFGVLRQVACHCRPRICLLKGCERWFCPLRSSERYCSEACCDAAREWSTWQAARRYRASDKGKERRRQQSCRYRERVRERRYAAQEQPVACEGHQEGATSEKIPCARPGCYRLFPPHRRSPLRKFCCTLCRDALRRVRQREARWQRRLSSFRASIAMRHFTGQRTTPVRCRILRHRPGRQ